MIYNLNSISEGSKSMKEEYYLRIRNTRLSRGLSVGELAKKAEISAKFLYDIESGKKGVSAEVLLRIATALNVSCDFLLMGKSESADAELIEIIKNLNEKERAVVAKIIIEIIGLRDCG